MGRALVSFVGLTEEESMRVQLYAWRDGQSVHNPILDECCPDSSCCCPDLQMTRRLRELFVEAYERGDSLTMGRILALSHTTEYLYHHPDAPTTIFLTTKDLEYSLH